MLNFYHEQHSSITLMSLTCPNCGESAMISLLALLRAVNEKVRFHCSDCNDFFMVKVESMTRVTELRNEAVDVGQGMASHTEDDNEINGNLELGA